MAFRQKTAKIFRIGISGLLGSGLVGYCVLFVANLHDRPRSAEVAGIMRVQRQRMADIYREDNSYFLLLGFGAPPDVDPMELGLRRYSLTGSAGPALEATGDALISDHDFRSQRSRAVTELADACSRSVIDCMRLMQERPAATNEWLTKERWLFERYRSLTGMTGFQEPLPVDTGRRLPSYSAVFQGQRLAMANAWVLANSGDTEAVREALDRDLIYWRMVLENSDALVTRMIAAAAIAQHFKLGNAVLAVHPASATEYAVPTTWRRAISDAERSMTRCLSGEWSYFDAWITRAGPDSPNPAADVAALPRVPGWSRLSQIVFLPFWQPQESSNRRAHSFLEISRALDVPYDRMPTAVQAADAIQASAFRPFGRIYNLSGDLIMSRESWRVSSYAARVSDLEGIRRAALLTVELRAAGITKGDMARALLAAGSVDPYTNEPFTWDEHTEAVVFRGLEPGDRGRHELAF